MTSSESEVLGGRSRKRSRGSAEDGGAKGVKKARGRPRVDAPEQGDQELTAADRRRTQIRLAQRAYRQRKETTISSLQQKSTQLHSIIDQMNRTFSRFNDVALKSGLLHWNPSLARELKHAIGAFASLAKTASDVEANDEEQEGGETVEILRVPEAASPTQQGLDIGWGYSAILDQSDKPTASRSPIQIHPEEDRINTMPSIFNTSLLPRRQFSVGEIFDQSRNTSSDNQTSSQQQRLPFGLVGIPNQHNPYSTINSHIYSVNIPTPNITPPTTRLSTPRLQLAPLNKTLAPIFTYSHDETNFARRLTRAALETGFQMLSTENVRPSVINYVFKLSLPYLSLDQLRARFRTLLARSVHEDLDFWETPFIHLGGAGTHYPRRDANGNITATKNSWTIRRIGPLEKKIARMENVADGRWEDLYDIDLGDFEGEWFDAYDVQGYLEEHWGCKLDPRSSFAECLVEDDESEAYDSTRQSSDDSDGSPGLVHSSTNSSTASSANSDTTASHTKDYNLSDAPFGLDMSFSGSNMSTFAGNSTHNNFPKFAIDLSYDQTLGLDLAPGFNHGFPTGTGMNLGLNMMDAHEMERLPVVRQKRKKVAWLEVDKLLDELIKHGVCLGRAPGFRRRDVDIAVQKALVSAY